MEPYTYRPLLEAPYSTRLIKIQPGTHDSDITCIIHDYTLRPGSTPGPYEALSYVWGDQTQKRCVNIQYATNASSNQTEFLYVTINLDVALRRLRDTYFPRFMWIDALSIDQENIEERGIQGFMAKMYSHAKGVLVWLGEEADGSSELFDGFLEVANAEQNERNSKANGLQKAAVALARRSWFNRIWVRRQRIHVRIE